MDNGDAHPMNIDDESDDSVDEIGKPTQSEGVASTSRPKKRKRKLISKLYSAESYSGTGNLKRHLKGCLKSTTRDIGQYMISSSRGVIGARNSNFNQGKFRELLVHAVVRHDLPFSFTEYEGVKGVFKYLEPDVTHITRNTTKADMLKMHGVESKRLRDELLSCPSRICLTSDAWTSIVTDSYLSLTAHYVDKNWVLQKRILNFSFFPPPHTGIALAEKLTCLVKSWGIEKKLFSITLDNASANDLCVGLLKNQFRLMNSLIYDGTLFHLRCCAHILNLIVQDGLKQIDESIDKIRVSVKYIKGSHGRKVKFHECCSQTGLDCKKALTQDVPTRWNSTYKMLSSAIYYRPALVHLSMSDSNYQSCPSMDEWDKIEKICDLLEVFYKATLAFSGSLYPTSILYFPKVFLIHLKLLKELQSPDAYMRKIADQMWIKFNKYWADFNLLLAVAVVFDPRYKYSFLEFSYAKLYGKDSPQLAKVKEVLYGVFDEYNLASKNATSSTSGGGGSAINSQVDEGDGGTSQSILKEFDLFEKTESSNSNEKQRELDSYLKEPRAATTSSICVLDFWKSQQYRYPVLAKMAMDILCVPVSTVASESAFSLGGRILDQYRSSMKPPTVEALICTRDWLFSEKVVSHADLEEVTENIMKLDIDKEEE
ncbi:zinc finger BED domain-containing protein RICESLEEPER 2-like protein [Tanacetum coccineum]